jgi:hypothetical protein
VARQIASLPPVASLFAAFLGYNPMGELIPPDVLASLPAHNVSILTGHEFFPGLMAGPFKNGLLFAFTFSALLYLLAAFASWRGDADKRQETDAKETDAGQPSLAG